MNEPKRRGRPPKVEPTAQEQIGAMQAEAVNSWADKYDMSKGAGVGSSSLVPSSAQAYANRVWAGQSVTADRPWRLARVKEALEGQGLSMEGVVLP